jgi:hypothetical protein
LPAGSPIRLIVSRGSAISTEMFLVSFYHEAEMLRPRPGTMRPKHARHDGNVVLGTRGAAPLLDLAFHGGDTHLQWGSPHRMRNIVR